MTIKDFAHLVGCNPQTLRYYDHVNLLKPVKVDPWSGYRYYEEEQALAFVKIKNLQKAGFTIDEIRGLLDQDDAVICRAFDEKIAETEKRLQEIKTIRQSYQTEMNQMNSTLEALRKEIAASMQQYDPAEEFGIGKETYAQIAQSIDQMMEKMIEKQRESVLDFPGDPCDVGAEEEADFPDLLYDPAYTVVYEKHGWNFVKDFFDEFSDLEDGGEYALLFELEKEKANNIAFSNVILNLLLMKNEGKKRTLGCNLRESGDGQNHFWLLKRK